MSLRLWYCIHDGQEPSIHRALHTNHQQNKGLLSVSSFVKKACSGIDSRTIWFHKRKFCRPGRNKSLGYTKVNSCETNVHWYLLWSAGFHEHQCNCAVTIMCVYSFSTEMNKCGGDKVENALVKIFIRSHAEFFLTIFLTSTVMLKNAATRFLILLPIENGFYHKKKTSPGFFYLCAAYLSPLKATFRNSSWSENRDQYLSAKCWIILGSQHTGTEYHSLLLGLIYC